MSATLSLIAALSTGLVIQSDTDCPSGSAIAAALAPLQPEEFSQPDPVLRVSSVVDGPTAELALTLRWRSGTTIASRQLPATGSCRRQARRIAVLVAAWEGAIADEPLRTPLAEDPAEQVEFTREVASGKGTAEVKAPAAVGWREAAPLHLEFALRLSWVEVGGVTSGFQLGGGYSWGRLSLHFGGWGELVRQVPSGPVLGGPLGAPVLAPNSSFSRIALEAGPVLRVWDGYPDLDLRLIPVGAMLLNGGSISLDPGVEVGFRATLGRGAARGFLEISAAVWPRFFGPATDQVALSPLEVFMDVGLSLAGS